MTIKVSRVFNGFFLAAFEAGGNRPQPQGLRASASRYYIKARRLGIKPGGAAHGASNEASGFSRFLSKEHIRSPRREIGYGRGVCGGKEGVAPASALAAYGSDEMGLRKTSPTKRPAKPYSTSWTRLLVPNLFLPTKTATSSRSPKTW